MNLLNPLLFPIAVVVVDLHGEDKRLNAVDLDKYKAAVVVNKTVADGSGLARIAGLLILLVVEESQKSQISVAAQWDCGIVGTFAEKENFPLCFVVDSGFLMADDECIVVVGFGVGS